MPSANALASAEGGFDRFRFHENIVRGLQAAGFQEPRPIQDDTIPACLEGRDVMGLAQTGTGKTAAFALPILEYFVSEPGPGPRALILAPTRELANQIDAETRLLAQFTKVKTTTVFGGVPARAQIQALRRQPEIVVGCPGRVLDLLQQRQLDLRDIEVLVLDEADHMFDMGFLPDIKRILAALPSDRQNLLFSATMPKAIRQLAEQILNDPHVVEIAHTAPALRIEHALYPIAAERKKDLLDRLLAEDDCNSAIIFTRTKHRAKRLAIQLSKQGLSAIALQGNMSQAQRDRAMNGFRKGSYDILVATDIAARGLDVAGIDYVINFDPPSTPDIYTHRIGRTGRSEASGKACTFVTRDDADWVRDTERVLDASIPQRYWPGFDREPIVAGKGASGARPAGRPSNAKTRSGGGDRRNKGPAKRGRSRKRGGRSASSAANR